MVDTARSTVTVPQVTPDESGWETEQSPPDRDWPGGSGAEEKPRSAVEGPRAVVRTGRRGGGGGPGGTRPRTGGFDLRNTWQILVGSLLIPLGVVFILIAWYGAAHTAYVQQQIPYLVSGSFAGVGCLVLGGMLYWAHWLYRIYDQADLHHQEQLAALEQVLRAVADGRGHGGDENFGNGFGSPDPGVAGRVGAPSYVVTPSGSVYHQPRCPVVAHHPDGLRSISPDATGGLEPCRICIPGAG